MVLKEKDENDFEAICISAIYKEHDIDVKTLISNTYANMILSKCKRILMVFLFYDVSYKIWRIDIRILSSDDEEIESMEAISMVNYLKNKRNIGLRDNTIGRNELCPCRKSVKNIRNVVAEKYE